MSRRGRKRATSLAVPAVSFIRVVPAFFLLFFLCLFVSFAFPHLSSHSLVAAVVLPPTNQLFECVLFARFFFSFLKKYSIVGRFVNQRSSPCRRAGMILFVGWSVGWCVFFFLVLSLYKYNHQLKLQAKKYGAGPHSHIMARRWRGRILNSFLATFGLPSQECGPCFKRIPIQTVVSMFFLPLPISSVCCWRRDP